MRSSTLGPIRLERPYSSRILAALGGTLITLPIPQGTTNFSSVVTRWPLQVREMAVKRPTMPAPMTKIRNEGGMLNVDGAKGKILVT